MIGELQEVTWALPPADANRVSAYSHVGTIQEEGGSSKDEDGNEGNPYEVDLSKSNLTPQQLVKAREFLNKWKCVFSQHEYDLGTVTGVEHKIPLTDETPFKMRHHGIPPSTQNLGSISKNF